MKRLLAAVFAAITRPYYIAYCRWHGVAYHSSWLLRGKPVFRRAPKASITIGKRFRANSVSRYNALGVFQPVILTSWGAQSVIAIGDDVGISGCSITALERVSIGDRVLIGSGALITDNDGHPIAPEGRYCSREAPTAPITIENDVFIGARAIILKGVHIGEGAVIGAGAVVTKAVPAFGIAVGNPARVVGDSRKHHPTNQVPL